MQKKHITSILAALVFVLSFSFVLSFFTTGNNKDKRKPVKTALLNPKNISNIKTIEIKKNDEALILANTNDFWIVMTNQETNAIPADSEKIGEFLEDLAKTRNLYKVADKPSKNDSFGLQNENSLTIRYTLKDSSVNELIFGSENFSLSARYLMTGKALSVYEIDNSLEKYLTLKVQAWSDPYIISKSVAKNISQEDIQVIKLTFENDSKILKSSDSGFIDISSKLLELRHGGIGKVNDIQNSNPNMELLLQLGTKSEIKLSFYECESIEREFVVKTQYTDSLNNTSNTFYTKISLWTYNKIKEIIL